MTLRQAQGGAVTARSATKPPREEDPRYPLHRLEALLDEGSLRLISPLDDSGMLAVHGTVDGTPVVAFCPDWPCVATKSRVGRCAARLRRASSAATSAAASWICTG